jgi:WD40-like Beta Propeller Repeat
MNLVWRNAAATIVVVFAANVRAASEIVVAIRYLQAEGVSHSHLYLYRSDGKFLRQLTNDNSGQDVDPIFAPDGESIVFTRERTKSPLEFWSVKPLGGESQKFDSAPDWYEQTKTSPYFTNREEPKPNASASVATAEAPTSPGPAGLIGRRQIYKSPDGSVELILREDPGDPDDHADGEHHGKHYVIRYLKTGIQADFGALPGFFGVFEILHERQNPDRQFLIEGLLRVAFFGLHLNSTDGDTCSALDLNGPRLVRLSPNWAAPVALPGEAAFLTLTENRFVPISATSKTANCSYVEYWDAQLQKIRYARANVAAVCYGASMYRPDKTPNVVTIRQNAD